MTHERNSLTRSTYLQKNRNVCSAVVLQARMRTSVGPGLSFVAALLECIRLKLRPTIHRNTCPGDPPSAIGGEECDHVGDSEAQCFTRARSVAAFRNCFQANSEESLQLLSRSHPNGYALQPPSTVKFSPLINADSG